jgi:uncharacterized peroxidase-related enzyme
VHRIAVDWRTAELTPVNAALCAFAEKLTLAPAAMNDADIAALRAMGFDDRAIHDATQVASYFNYINRIADTLDVELETLVHPWDERPPDRDA